MFVMHVMKRYGSIVDAMFSLTLTNNTQYITSNRRLNARK